MSPNIVNMCDWGQDDGTFYIVMEYVRGTDQKTMIDREGMNTSVELDPRDHSGGVP